MFRTIWLFGLLHWCFKNIVTKHFKMRTPFRLLCIFEINTINWNILLRVEINFESPLINPQDWIHIYYLKDLFSGQNTKTNRMIHLHFRIRITTSIFMSILSTANNILFRTFYLERVSKKFPAPVCNNPFHCETQFLKPLTS